MTSDVDTQIRDALYAVVERAPSTHERDPSGLVRRAVSRRRRRRMRSVAAGSALCVAVIATVTVLVTNGGGDTNPRVRTRNSTAEGIPPTQPNTTNAPTRVAVGPISLTLPSGFAVESQDDLTYKNGRGRSVLIRAGAAREVGAALCQVAWVKWTVYPADTRPRSMIQIEPVDGSASFQMDRVEGSDTDLGARMGDTENFSVDCDDLATARMVAAHLTLPG